MSTKTVRQIDVLGIEKNVDRKFVYVFKLSWADGNTTIVKKKYGELFKFHCNLLDSFPEAAGLKNKARTIPLFPGKQLMR